MKKKLLIDKSTMKFKLLNIFLFVLFLCTTKSYSQTCGFGCLGLGSIYAGYTIQGYDVENINYILNKRYSSARKKLKQKINFDKGKGFRIGANLFKINHKGAFLTAKCFYQFLKEEQSSVNIISNIYKKEFQYELKTNYWGLGIDLGIPISKSIHLKIIDGGVNFYKIKLVEKGEKNSNADEIKFESDKYKMGYSVGSGVIFYLIEDYISLEATAQYHIFEENKLTDKKSNAYFQSDKSIVNLKEISYTLQLNIGLPL